MKNGRPLTLTLVFSSGGQLSNAIALQLKQELDAVGIDAELHPYAPTMLKAPAGAGGPIFGGRFNLVIVPIYQDAGPYAAQFFICSERAPVGFNMSRMCDPRVDTLFTDIIDSNDPARRDADTRAIERRLAVDRPQIPLLQVRTIAVVPDRLRGFAPVAVTPYVDLWKWNLQP
jgi:ABC-type transport system substrate-binding protein